MDRWIPWALRLAALSLLAPLMRHPEGLGFADWDFVLDKFEAARRTILFWHQFPWWNPWCRGGFPLAAEPQIGAISLATPFVLALGTSIGLRVTAVLCVLVAVEGSYRLAMLWLRDSWGSAAAALVYALNGAVIVNLSQGYILVMSYCSLPWLAYYAFRLGESFRVALWLGFWMAFVVLNGIQYVSLFAIPLLAAIGIRALRAQPPESRSRVVARTAASIGTFFLLCGWRLATVLLVLLDDRRERATAWNESPWSLFHYLLDRPEPNWPETYPGWVHHVFVDLTTYVGPVALALGVVSLWYGWRWWHWLILVSSILAIGSTEWYHPSYWLKDWPFFGSAHVVPRWRILALLGLGLSVGSVLARFRYSRLRWVRGLPPLIVLAIAADFLLLGHQHLPRAFSVAPEPRRFPGPAVRDIVNVRDGLGFACAMRGYGVIRGYEPMLSYRRDAPTLRRAREDDDYRGEAWSESGRIEPVGWSPNRVVFQIRPGQEIELNQNPGSWWRVNGQAAFAGLRCAEPMVPFVARADASGRLVLEIHPRGLVAGVALHFLGAALVAAAWVIESGKRKRVVTIGQHEPQPVLLKT